MLGMGGWDKPWCFTGIFTAGWEESGMLCHHSALPEVRSDLTVLQVGAVAKPKATPVLLLGRNQPGFPRSGVKKTGLGQGRANVVDFHEFPNFLTLFEGPA